MYELDEAINVFRCDLKLFALLAHAVAKGETGIRRGCCHIAAREGGQGHGDN